ncbi:MAG: tRNA lysidine(34) synthetase TilS [Terriglobales bacterium]
MNRIGPQTEHGQLATGYRFSCTIFSMHELAVRLLTTIRKNELLRAGDRVAVAVSGGADSVALLLLLLELQNELGIVLSVAHVNHKLRSTESDEDEQFVARLASDRELEFASCTAALNPPQGAGIESAARRLRYQFFRELARAGRASKIATAHTLDDQAETVLLRMFRGTGIRGLAGILPRLRLQDGGLSGISEASFCGEVVRPLLGFWRADLREYLRARGQDWREDSSNDDVSFLRNRVRRRLMPLIEKEFGTAAVEHMAELAEIARAEEELASSQYPVTRSQSSALSRPFSIARGQQFVSGTPSPVPSNKYSLPDAALPANNTEAGGGDDNPPARNSDGAALQVRQLRALPLAAARRVVRGWIEANAPEAGISFRLIEDILDLARGPAGRKFELPGAACTEGGLPTAGATPSDDRTNSRIVRRGRSELVLETLSPEVHRYQYEVAVPGKLFIPELGVSVTTEVVDVESVPEQERPALLSPARLDAVGLGAKIVIRNWRAGDRYWPANTSKEKKVKDQLCDRHVTGREKKLWPVAECQSELVWMRGFAAPSKWQARAGKAIWIREVGGSRG